MAIRDNNFVLGDPTDGVFNVTDANNIKAETDNYIDTSSQTKSESDLFQMAKTGAVVASKGDFYKESAGSAADVYLLEADDDLADVWRLKNGMRFRFKVVNANTGASTVNINSLGAKDLKILGGDLSAGDLSVGNFVEVVYNESLDYFELQTQRLLPKQITIANGTDSDHDIDFTAGNFDFDDQSGQATLSAITKQIDAAWAEGTNAGGLDTGTVAADTFYYLFAIYNPTTQTSDALFSISSTSPTLPSGYTKKKFLKKVRTDTSGNLIAGYITDIDTLLSSSGYTILENNLILQWRQIAGAIGDFSGVTHNFPITFPNQVLAINVHEYGGSSNASLIRVNTWTTSTFTVYRDYYNTTVSGFKGIFMFSIGF
jgi:hypothetical protein